MLGIILFTVNVWAFPIAKDDLVKMDSSKGDNYGMILWDGDDKKTVGDWYHTFCVESEINFWNDKVYEVASVGETVEDQGDEISEVTKWLYAAYFQDVFDNVASGQTLINKVQNAIWFSEDEAAGIEDDYNELYAYYSSNSDILSNWLIQVVNIVRYDGYGGDGMGGTDRQSQLVGIKVAPVPEPATLMLFGIGLLGIAGINRRKNN